MLASYSQHLKLIILMWSTTAWIVLVYRTNEYLSWFLNRPSLKLRFRLRSMLSVVVVGMLKPGCVLWCATTYRRCLKHCETRLSRVTKTSWIAFLRYMEFLSFRMFKVCTFSCIQVATNSWEVFLHIVDIVGAIIHGVHHEIFWLCIEMRERPVVFMNYSPLL